jgi:hypothetical protein
MRGIESGKVFFYVEKDLQTVLAYENGKLKWKTNVISVCGKTSIGKAKIRIIKLKKEKLQITFGKRSWAEIEKVNGKIIFVALINNYR